MTDRDRKSALKAFNQLYEAWDQAQYLEFCIREIENLLYRVKNRFLTVADVIDKCKYPCFPGFEDLDQKTPLTKLKVEYILPYVDFDQIEYIPDFFDYLKLNGNVIEDVTSYPEDFWLNYHTSIEAKQDENDPNLFHVDINRIRLSLRIHVEYKRNEYKVLGLRKYPNKPVKQRYETYVKEMRDHFKTVEEKIELESATFTFIPDYSIHFVHLDITDDERFDQMYHNSSLLNEFCEREIANKHKIWYTRKNINQLGYKTPTDREITER